MASGGCWGRPDNPFLISEAAHAVTALGWSNAAIIDMTPSRPDSPRQPRATQLGDNPGRDESGCCALGLAPPWPLPMRRNAFPIPVSTPPQNKNAPPYIRASGSERHQNEPDDPQQTELP